MPLPGFRPSALIAFRAPSDDAAPLRLAFGTPRRVLRAMTIDAVVPLLQEVDALARAGAWCVGHLAYEAAPAFDPAFATHASADGTPLASFAVHDAPLDAERAQRAWALEGEAEVRWTSAHDRAWFDAAIAATHRAIADGRVYQVNVTAPLDGLVEGDSLALFAALRRAQPNAYAAWIAGDSPDDAILSVSPELFFDWRDGRLLARPMKGTAPRGRDAADDVSRAAALRASPKERAENLMIVDLLRNDLSRVAEPFSVTVPRLFEVEAWPTVWQMSSDVTARTRPGTTLADIFGALFPCGSVTGAPKVEAMRLIRTLEPQPRGVYCGAVGLVRPGGAATFNVPIRTLAMRRHGTGRHVRCGIGSGITADATAAGEWAEWRHKRAFLERASRSFELLETLRLAQGEFVDADAHLDRIARAGAHFGFAPPRIPAEACLRSLAETHPTGTWRVRLLADAFGHVRAEALALARGPSRVRVQLAGTPMLGADGEFVRFKTTRRAHYEAFAPTDPAVFDTLLWNEAGEVTEFTRGNVALRLDGEWLTPALHCGLLPGVARARLLREGRLREAVLRPADLARADGLAFVNSLRGWLDADLVQAESVDIGNG